MEAEKQAGHSIKRACELPQVSRAAFHARRTHTAGPARVRDAELTEKITRFIRDRAEPTECRASTPCSSGKAPDANASGSRG